MTGHTTAATRHDHGAGRTRRRHATADTGNPMIDIAAALIAAGMPTGDVAALATALYRACQANHGDALGHEGDAEWDRTHGEHRSAGEHDEIAAELREQARTWRCLLYALEHPAAATAEHRTGHRQPRRNSSRPRRWWRAVAGWYRRCRQRIVSGTNSR